jgi:cell filamentation protein, protein adenylyltransferase
VNDEAARIAEQKAREEREADLVSNRIRELHVDPIKGNFDAEHLKAVHAYIFQDLPHHRPGIVREDTADWIKHRALEGRPVVYDVYYASQGIQAKIATALNQFGGPDAIKGLTPDVAATRLAELYGNLDYAHAFYEGNSRTLREFTRELAGEAGYALDWVKTGIGTNERNELYVARDLTVLEHAFPDLTPERAMQTNDRAEYETSFVLERLRSTVGDRPLAAIIRDGLSPEIQRERDGQEHNDGSASQEPSS